MKKILIIQIDSLSYDVLQRAIKEEYMPYTAKLLKDKWHLKELFSGLPSTTPAAQINLFYGLSLLPGFRFVEKKEMKVFSAEYPEMVEWLEKSSYLKKVKGLLRGGIGVLSIFSGGSKKSVSANMVEENKSIFLRYLPFLINPFTIIIRLLRAVSILFIERLENTSGDHVKSGRFYALKRVLHEALLSELGLYTVKKVISTDNKVIYINFSGYDEISHHYGGYSRFAFYYLSIIDQYIRILHKEIINKNPEREIIIISDHGQSPSIPIIHKTDYGIGAKISSFYPEKKIIEHKLEYASKYLLGTDLYLLNSGGFCQGYDLNNSGQLSKSQLEKDYPDIIKKISNIDEVELVVFREKSSLYVAKKDKTYELNQKNILLILNNLKKEYSVHALKGLIQIMSGPFAPDFCALAKIIDENTVVVFENQLSAHGAVGGLQTQSFLLSQEQLFENKQLPDLVDLHDELEKRLYCE